VFIVRDDGVVFGDGADRTMEELGMEVHLPEIPPADTLWSKRGVQGYRSGARPGGRLSPSCRGHYSIHGFPTLTGPPGDSL
jgi:hypothetical protein